MTVAALKYNDDSAKSDNQETMDLYDYKLIFESDKRFKSSPDIVTPDSTDAYSRVDLIDVFRSSVKRFGNITANSMLDQNAILILRTHYLDEILKDLGWLSENHVENSVLSLPRISTILNLIQEYCQLKSNDPYSSFLLAIFDGLISEKTHLGITKDVYGKLRSYIIALNKQKLTFVNIDKYINKLEQIGLNTLPY